MSTVVTISDLSEADIPAVLSLSRRLETDPMPCSFWGLDEEKVSHLLQSTAKEIVIACIDQAVVGIGALTRGEFYQSHLAELSVAVCPNHRRQGIARLILTRLEQLALTRGVEVLKALVWTRNLASQRLAESLGYEHRATLYAEFKSVEFGEIDDCVYYKRLVPQEAR